MDRPSFAAPVHRALYEPMLMAGAPRGLAIINGTLAAAIGLGLRAWLPGLLVFALGHLIAARTARSDLQVVDVGRRHLRLPSRLEV